jgi:hypothetical protein
MCHLGKANDPRVAANVLESIRNTYARLQTYEKAFSEIQASGRRLDALSGLGLESLLGNVVDHGIRFRKAPRFLSKAAS